jgi:hypothetical protein
VAVSKRFEDRQAVRVVLARGVDGARGEQLQWLQQRQPARCVSAGPHQSGVQLGERQCSHSRCGKLDRQRQAVQRHTELTNEAGVLRREGETRLHGPGALDEQRHGANVSEGPGGVWLGPSDRLRRLGEGKRSDRHVQLPAQAQRRPGGDKDHEVRAGCKQL